MFPELWGIGTLLPSWSLASVEITFQSYGRNQLPIVKAELEIHQAREFLAWLDKSISRLREGACLFHANKILCWRGLE